MPVDIREIVSDGEIASAFPLMRELRDRLKEETFVAEVWIEVEELLGG